MNTNVRGTLAGLCALVITGALGGAAYAQQSEVKEKPPIYTYVAEWAIPRAQWADMEKSEAADIKLMEKGFSSGTIVGYGNDMNLIHEPDGATHDDWWTATSMAGLLNQLDQAYKAGTPTSPVLSSATKHADFILVSRFYNWHSGSWKDVYTREALYKLKPGAPPDTIDMISKNLVVPLMEKMLADGAIHEYEIDTQAVHTDSPSQFWVIYIAANAAGLDKVNAALLGAMKSNPFGGPAFNAMVDMDAHRDALVRGNATYK